MDNMIQKMEAYAANLEEIVQSRTAELMEEKKKSDELLYRMLPSYVPCQSSYPGYFREPHWKKGLPEISRVI